MKSPFNLTSFAMTGFVIACSCNLAMAQHKHSDIEFGYNDVNNPTAFIIEGDEITSDGIRFFESEMEELDPLDPGNYFSDEPGFDTNPDEGLFVNHGDQIWLNAVDASANSPFGVGYVNFYNPMTDALEAYGRIGIIDNSNSTDDLILSGLDIESGPNPQFLGLGDSNGELHDHIIADLLDDNSTLVGAYGLMFELQSDFDGDGNSDLTSEKFWIIWNYGLSEEQFENQALAKFGVVPEPGSAVVITLASLALLRRRR